MTDEIVPPEPVIPGTIAGDRDALQAAAQVPGEGNNLLTDLRHLRDQAGDESKVEYFAIPHFRGRLALQVTYRADLWDKFKIIAQRVEKDKSTRKELYAHADTLVLVTEAIVVKKDEQWHNLGECFPEFVPVPEDQTLPLTFGDRVVCQMFELKRPDGSLISDNENATAREVVLALFNNNLSVTQVHNLVSDWLQGNDEDSETALGESSGALK